MLFNTLVNRLHAFLATFQIKTKNRVARILLLIPLFRSTQASTNYKEAFALFDKRGNGRVALQSLGDLLRACGQNPTLAEIKDLEKSIGGDCE